MLYVEQSLTAGERVLHVGRFHWIYLLGASFWLVLGFGAFIGVMTGGVIFDVRTDMNQAYPGLPHEMFWQGWHDTVANRGGYIALMREANMGLKLGAFLCLLLGVALFAQMMIFRATTEIAVTTKRLVIKEGVVARRVDEMAVDRIESVHVTQSVLGRILDFGVVMVRGMGIGEIMLPVLAHPIMLRNAIERAKDIDEAKAAGRGDI